MVFLEKSNQRKKMCFSYKWLIVKRIKKPPTKKSEGGFN